MTSRPLRRRSKRSFAARVRIVWVLVLMGLVALAALAYALLTAPQLRVRTIDVRIDGTRVSRADVLARARIAAGENIWLIGARAAASRIDAIPYVNDAAVQRSLPATVVVTVTERSPLACVNARVPFTIDATVRVLQRGCARPDLVRIELPALGSPVPGATLEDPSLAELVRDAATLSAAGLAVQAVGRDAFGGLIATESTGVRLLFGDDADLAAKAALVGPIRQAAKRPLRTVDLRSPTTPVVSYR